MRVLVVEDQETLADRIAEGLRDEGMAVDVAYDGAAAMEITAVTRYDVVVLDRDLPRVHGDAVCAGLVAGPAAGQDPDAHRGRRGGRPGGRAQPGCR